jgi:serine/threonine protein kinase
LQKLGKYEILAEIGHGAMGVVYKARDPFIGRLVALKTINSNLVDRPDLLERFYQEAQAAGNLQHPNIVTIFELGKEKDTPFIAMEYLDGESLEKALLRQADLPFVLKVGYIVRICQALEYAHKNRVVHRDIKPANIMVNSDGVVKVVDFGIARLVDFSRTHTNTVIGTPIYMAPELFRKNRADERTDIWAAGVTFYELICYQRPFPGDGYDLIRSIVEDDFPSPSSLVAECTPELEAVIRRMLQKQRSSRYRSMEDVLLHLEPIWNRLRSDAAAALAQRAREFYQLGELAKAQDALRRALQIDISNKPVKSLLEKVTAELHPLEKDRAGAEKRPEQQEDREQTRKEIQQRVQQIRFKITRGEFSDAIDLARQTLATLGPDTDVSQLLQAAEMEAVERNKRREKQQQYDALKTVAEEEESRSPDAGPELESKHISPAEIVLSDFPVQPQRPASNPSTLATSLARPTSRRKAAVPRAQSPTSQALNQPEKPLSHAPAAPAFLVLLRKPAVWTLAVLLLSLTSWAAYHFMAKPPNVAEPPLTEKIIAQPEPETKTPSNPGENETRPVGNIQTADIKSKRLNASAGEQKLFDAAMEQARNENWADARDQFQEVINRKGSQNAEAKKQLAAVERALEFQNKVQEAIHEGAYRTAKTQLDSSQQWPKTHDTLLKEMHAAEQHELETIRSNAQAAESKSDIAAIQHTQDELHGFQGRVVEPSLVQASHDLDKTLSETFAKAQEKAGDKAAFDAAVAHYEQAVQKKDVGLLNHQVHDEFQKIANGSGIFKVNAQLYLTTTIPNMVQSLMLGATKVILPPFSCGGSQSSSTASTLAGGVSCALLDAPLEWLGNPTVDFPDVPDSKLPYTLALWIIVDPNGNVKIDPIGNVEKAFLNKAKEASKHWKTTIPKSNGKPVSVRFPFSILFRH